MLKTNLDAKVAKLDKKLKMVELPKLKKEKLDKDGKADGESIVQGEGYIVTDRNSSTRKTKEYG